jgi:DNA polymerase-3 subunit alpha
MIDKAMEVAGGVQKDRMVGQLSFFDRFEDQENFKKTVQEIPNIPEWPENQLLANEKEMLGFYITKHPLARFEKMLRNFSTCPSTKLSGLKDGDEVLLGGIITKAKYTVTRRTNEKMAIISLEDLDGVVEVLVFPKTYVKAAEVVKPDAMIFVKGRVSLREETPKIVADEIAALESVRQKYTKAILIDLVMAGLEKSALDNLKRVLTRYPGRVPVYINFIKPDGKRATVAIDRGMTVDPHDGLVKDIEKIFGTNVVSFSV